MFIPVLKLSCELLNVGSFLLVPAVPPVIFVFLAAAAQALQSVSVSIFGTSSPGHSLSHKAFALILLHTSTYMFESKSTER